MFCDNCGAEIMDGSKVCVMCGAPTSGEHGHEYAASASFVTQAKNSSEESVQGKTARQVAYKEANSNSTDKVSTPTTSLSDFYEEVDDPASKDDTGFFVVPGETGPATQSRSAATNAERRRAQTNRRKPLIAILVGACVAVALVGVVSFVLLRPSQKQVEPKVEPEPVQKTEPKVQEVQKPVELKRVAITLPVEAAGLDADGSRIPVKVEGTKQDGAPLSEDGFVAFDGTGLELPSGTYAVRVQESPISAAGDLYGTVSGELSITVEEGKDVVLDPADAKLTLDPLRPVELSADLIERARTWIGKDPLSQDKADALAEVALAHYNEALATAARPEANQNTSTNQNNQNNNQDNYYNQNDDYSYVDYSDYADNSSSDASEQHETQQTAPVEQPAQTEQPTQTEQPAQQQESQQQEQSAAQPSQQDSSASQSTPTDVAAPTEQVVQDTPSADVGQLDATV